MRRFVAVVACALAIVAAACAHPKKAPADPPPANIPSHIMIWAVDQKFSQGETATPAQVRRYVTYAMSGLGNDKPVKDCGGSRQCYSLFYFDPAHVYDSDLCSFSADKLVVAASSEDWYIHLPGYSDKAHRIQGTYTRNCKGQSVTVPVYSLNQSNPAVQRYFAGYLQQNADAWDYYEMDDTSSTTVTQFYGAGGGFCKAAGSLNGYCNKTQEMPNDAAIVAAHTSFVRALKHRDGRPMQFIYNGVTFAPQGPQVVLLQEPQFKGVLCENCIISAGTFRPQMYAKVLSAMAQANAIPNGQFVELNTGKSPAGSGDQIDQRVVTTAVAWLGFKDGRTVVWPNLEFDTRNLAVWPEDALYPTRAVQSMSSGPNDIAVAPSVWRREFGACYNNGASIGPCAAVLNGSNAPVTVSSSWFQSRFSHAITLRGGDALNGGSMDFTSSPSSITIAPGRAVLLVR